MTTNKPGTVNQQPLYGCTSCYEECTYPADHLHVHDGKCWCESCWCEIADWRDWIKLEPFKPALQADHERLQAECEKLRKDAETERAIQRAAEVLPPGFRIEIEIEKDYGGVALFSPGAIAECDFHGGIAEQIADAIDAALQGDQP